MSDIFEHVQKLMSMFPGNGLIPIYSNIKEYNYMEQTNYVRVNLF